MFVLDSHCDTPSMMVEGRDLTLDNELAHIDIPKLKRGGVDAAFFALYIPAEMDTDAAYAHACKMYDVVMDMIRVNSDKVALTVSEQQAYENKDKGLISIFLGLENASPIGESLERLREFYDKGVRYVTLCHSKDNLVCDSCASAVKTWNGLSPFGREVVAEMNRLGMLVDVSHISDKAFYDVIECSSKPIVATHSCCRALADHPRNMTDDMIRTLAQKGGVIQINFYPVFLDAGFSYVPDSEQKVPSYKLIADHIDHVVGLVGIDHVGIGSDFDGIDVTPEGMDDISQMPKLFDELRSRGYSEENLSKIASKNFFSAFSSSDSVR